MQLNIESPRIKLREKIIQLTHRKFEKMKKMYRRINYCNVVFRKEIDDAQKSHIVSAAMGLPKTVVFAEERAETFEVALERVISDLEHQLRHHKDKLEEKR